MLMRSWMSAQWRGLCAVLNAQDLRKFRLLSKLYTALLVAYLTSVVWIKESPLLHLNTAELIVHHGYPAETHQVITSDGYLLQIHRIGQYGRRSRGPIILMHGFTCSSSMWVMQGPQSDLAFKLAAEGFDVWLSNFRGNSYTHLNDTAKTVHNDHSFHEMASLDMPAVIDYVIEETGYPKVGLVGHSMGTTVALSGLAYNAEYNDKIAHVALIAPVTTRKPFTEYIHKLMEYSYLSMGWAGNEIVDGIGLFRKNVINTSWSWIIARTPYPIGYMAAQVWRLFAGPDTKCQIMVPPEVLSAHVPDAMIHHTLNHYYDNMYSGEFRMRHFGTTENLRRYNSSTAPPYNLGAISAPISVFTGTVDTISPPQDFYKFLPQFNTPVQVNSMEGFNHIDLVWSAQATKHVFPKIIQNFKSAYSAIDGQRLKCM